MTQMMTQSGVVSKEYKFVDHHRTGRCVGGPGLLYKDSLKIIILYRPPNLDNHRVPMSKFFTEFSY